MVLMGGTFLMMMLVPSWRDFAEPVNMVVPLMTFAFGAILLAVGGRPTRREISLARVTPQDARLHIYPQASSMMEGQTRSVWFDEVEAIWFGMTRFELEQGSEVKVEAYTACVKLWDGSVIPVVEASLDKKVVFDVAAIVSQSVGAPLEQVGLGV